MDESLKDVVRAVESVGASIEAIDAQIAKLKDDRDALAAQLSAVRAVLLGGQPANVAHPPAAEHPAPKVTYIPTPRRKGDEKSSADRIRGWALAQDEPFTMSQLRRALDVKQSYAHWILSGLVSEKKLMRVEGKRYLRASLVVDGGPHVEVTPSTPRSPNDATLPAAGTTLAAVLAWAREQPGSFHYGEATKAFPEVSPGVVGVSLSSLRKRGFLRRLERGEYEAVREATEPQEVAA